MNQNKRLTVTAQFEYWNPRTHQPFFVERNWICADTRDAERIVRYHGFKTGSVEAKCRLEEHNNEEIK